jgi:hypothetical protein
VPTPLLIHADSQRDADMFVATGVAVVDPFTYLELDGRRIIVASVLEEEVIRRDSRATEVWPDEEFGRTQLMLEGLSWHDAAMEVVRRVLEKAGVASVAVPPSFPVGLADHLRGRGITVTPDRDLFELRRRSKDADQLAAIRTAQRGTEDAFRAVRELLASASPGPDGLVAGGQIVTCERVRDTIVSTLRDRARRARARPRQRPHPSRRADHHRHLPARRIQPLLRRHDPDVLLRRGARAAAGDARDHPGGATPQHRGDRARRGRPCALGGGLRRDRGRRLPHTARPGGG